MLRRALSRRRAWMLLTSLPALPLLGRIAPGAALPDRGADGTGAATDGWILRPDDT